MFSPGKPQVTHEEPPATPLSKGDLASSSRSSTNSSPLPCCGATSTSRTTLVTAQLRGGMNCHEWRSGNIPVIPFPAKDFAFAKSKLRYSHGNFARYDVLIWAKPHAQTGTTTFLDGDARGRRREAAPLARGLLRAARRRSLAAGQPEPESAPGERPGAERTKAPLGVAWVLVPLSVLGLVVLIPTGLAIRGWRRNRRADRD